MEIRKIFWGHRIWISFFFALQQVNTEEELLEFEATQFPILQTMIAYKEPYDKLWRTALTFHNKHEAWLNGMGLKCLLLLILLDG